MPGRWAPCNVPGCGNLTQRRRCEECEREADARRGTAAQRGYNSRGHARFRRLVLRRDRICVLCHAAPARQADHYPVDRRTLVLRGEDPNDPRHGRGLCTSCHSKATAVHQPGGWAAQQQQL
jgi:5-methylcytosine-specific restriction enzyme A